jgi:hypothetical protein
MLLRLRLFPLFVFSLLLTSCGYSVSNNCSVKTAIVPSSATADHSAAVPGNQVQFSLVSSVKGTCPLPPDFLGVWKTSDSVNTTISNQAPTQGLATCQQATTTPVTITNTSTIGGHPFPPAALVCR